MAKNRQVVREDVVRVSFEAPENPFQDIVDDLKDLKKTTEKTIDGAEKELQDLGKAGKEAGKGFQDITKESQRLKKMLGSIDKDIASFNTRLTNAKQKFDSFKTSLKNIVTHPLKNTANSLSKIKDRLTEGQKGVKGFTTGLKNVGKIGFEKLVSGAKKLSDGLKTVANKLSDIAKKAGKTAFNALKKLAGISFKTLTAGLAGTAVAVGSIVTKSVQSFADYEQLVGGVDTLFKDSSKIVQQNAARAFETAGLSANAYMETVTSFSASLLQGLKGDTKKAASVADKALVDMSDNANKMGTSMESIQNAYQGFAKDNYTMLDNLKLGYGGTAGEMARLVNESGVLGKNVKVDAKSIKDVGFDKIIEAIHVVQDELGITGTTSKEASTTITGSLNAMKGAWQNMLTALVTGENFDGAIENLVNSAKTFAGNVMPAIKSALGGVGKLVEEIAPMIEKELPTLVTELLPPLIKATVSLFAGLIKSLPNIVKTFAQQMPTILTELVTAINDTFGTNIDLVAVKDKFEEIKTKVIEVAGKVKSFVGSIIENWPTIKNVLGGVIGVIGSVKLAIAGINAVMKINELLTKAKAAGDILMAAKTKILNSAVWSSVKAFGAQAIALMTNPVTWIVVGIIALIAAIILLVKNWDKVKEVAIKCWDKIKEVWGKVSGWVNEKVISPIAEFFGGLWKNIKDVASNIKNSIVEAFKSAWDKVTSVWGKLKDFFSGIWDGLKSTGSSLKNALVSVWKNAVKAVAKPVNKLIGGANWVLEKLGSDTVIKEWQPYARGTDGHKGGNALVNDGRGAELVQMPNGNTFIPKGRNVFIPNAPVGMKVLPAEQTAKVMGKSSPTFSYEGGIGDWAIWDFFTDAKGLVGKIVDKFVNYDGVAGYALSVGKALIGKATSTMKGWIEKLFDKFGGKSLGSYVASAGVEQWRSTVVQALKMEGLYTADNVKRTLYQMQTESGGNPYAINLWDSNAKKGTPSKGLMQVIDPTFKAYARAGFDKNIYDPLSNILASLRYATSRYGSLAKAYRGVGYANGGIATRPSIFGEAGAEMAIPLSWNKRQRGIQLWMQTGQILGVTPEDSYLSHYTPENSYTTTNSSSTQNNTYNPTFVLNMNGASASEDNKRKVKRWIQEAIAETFGSMERTNPLLTEV